MQVINALAELPIEPNIKHLLKNITYLNEKRKYFNQISFTIDNEEYQINSQKIFVNNREEFEGKDIELWFITWKNYKGKTRAEFSLEYKEVEDEPIDVLTVFYLIDVDGSLFIKWHKKITQKTMHQYKQRIENNENMTLIDSINISALAKRNSILSAMFKYMKDSTYGDYIIKDNENHTTWKFICEVVLNEDSYTKKIEETKL